MEWSKVVSVEIAPFEYRTQRWQMALGSLISLFFVAIGLAIVLDLEGSTLVDIFGWLTVAFGLSCLFFSLRELVAPRMGLRLDAAGIHSRQALKANSFDLPWSQLARVRVLKLNGQPMVVLDASDPEWGLANVSPSERRWRAASARMTGSWMVIAPRVFGLRPDELVADIDRYYRNHNPDAPVAYPRPLEHRG